jgi:hypothetical protein
MGQVPFHSNWIWVEVYSDVRPCFLEVLVPDQVDLKTKMYFLYIPLIKT